MVAIANSVGWRHKSRDSSPCIWNTWRYWLFCCYYRHGRRVNSLCQITERLLFFQDRHRATQAFVGPSHFWSHTSLATWVVYSSASARRGSGVGRIMNGLCALKRLLQTNVLSLSTVWSCVTEEKSAWYSYRQTDIHFGVVQSNLTNILGMSKVSAKWVPRMLTKDQEKCKLDISKFLPSLYEDDPEEFMRRLVTQVETWVHPFEPEAKKQSMQWKHHGSPSPKKKLFLQARTVMVCMFWALSWWTILRKVAR